MLNGKNQKVIKLEHGHHKLEIKNIQYLEVKFNAKKKIKYLVSACMDIKLDAIMVKMLSLSAHQYHGLKNKKRIQWPHKKFNPHQKLLLKLKLKKLRLNNLYKLKQKK